MCVSLGEYPTIRYYRPRTPTHEASVLCSHLARFVQDELDLYAKFHEDFPPPSTRPRGVLYIVDRTMDLCAPILHEFTYQAMAFDLLPIKEGDKITYKTIVNEGRPDAEHKDVEIGEKDRIWVENRHRHMKDTIEKLMGDFQRFIDENPHFTKSDDNANSLNAIKDMLAGLPQFQEMKEAYSLHLSMAQECMNIFQKQKLPDLASVEQVGRHYCFLIWLTLTYWQILATGLDEDYKKPKNIADQVIRTLDDDSIGPPDRLRLLALYLMYKDGLLPSDLTKLLLHAQLPSHDAEVIRNLDLLGVNTTRALKDPRPTPLPLFPQKPPPATAQEEYALSRYEPALQLLLENHATGTVDPTTFPYTKPPLDLDTSTNQLSTTSLRSAKPTWAKSRNASSEPRQRVIVFMAGGATYSESRACYEVGRRTNKEVFLVTSHMLTPALFMRQLGDLSVDKRRLQIPAEMPKPQAPAHLFEKEEKPKPAPAPAPVPATGSAGRGLQGQGRAPQPPTQAFGRMDLGAQANGAAKTQVSPQTHKLTKEPEKEKKKKHHFFSSKK